MSEAVIFDAKHYALHDGPGIRQTIFFKGCPLNCTWCHNPESQQSAPKKYRAKRNIGATVFERTKTIGHTVSVHELVRKIEDDVIFFDQSGGGVTFSGGEPLHQVNPLAQLLKECRKRQIHTAVDTSGFAPLQHIQHITPLTQLWLYDLKIIDSRQHRKHTGVDNSRILRNLQWLDNNSCNVIIRFPVVPEITLASPNVNNLLEFLSQLKNIRRIDLLPYHNTYYSKIQQFESTMPRQRLQKPGKEEILHLKQLLEQIHFNVKIGG